jgi:hypothetical protein
MEPGAPKRRGWRQLIGIAAGVATIAGGGGVASAGGGGGVVPPDPQLRDFQCIEQCAGLKVATAGSRVAFTGADLQAISSVGFAGADGGRVGVGPVTAEPSRVEARVPQGAASGTVVLGGGGATLRTTEALKIVAQSAIPDGGDFKLSSAQATPRKTYFDGRRPPTLSYIFQGAAPTDVRVEVIDRETRQVVASFVDPAAEPNTENVATWSGTTLAGSLAPNGRYRFRIGNAAGGVAETTADARFGFYQYRFPSAPATPTAMPSAPGATTRARTSSPSAGPPCTPRAAGGSSGTRCTSPPATTSSSTSRAPRWTTCTPTCRSARR